MRSGHPWVLVAIGVALLIAGFFLYPGHAERDSIFYSRSVPGWFSLLMFIIIGVLVQLGRSRNRKRNASDKSDSSKT
jgi:hypothetical protein